MQIEESPLIIEYAKNLMKSNVSIKDALHVSCAVGAKADCFITTDRKLFLNKLTNSKQIRVITPITFIEEQDL